MAINVQKAFGIKLRSLREKHGLTQEDLADKAGLHFTYVGQTERGLRNLTIQSIYKLAKALKVKSSELMPF